jgi:hypothetical protein
MQTYAEYTACAYNERVTHNGGVGCSTLGYGNGGQKFHAVSCGTSTARYCSVTKVQPHVGLFELCQMSKQWHIIIERVEYQVLQARPG